MKKVILLILILISSLSFSTDGFKELKWGTDKNTVIEKFGSKYSLDKKNKNLIHYSILYDLKEKLYFANLEFLSLDFIFRDNKLVSWTGSQYVDASTLETLLNAYFKKYGENFYILDSRRDGSFYTYYDKDGVIEIFAESYTDNKGRTYIKLNYREPFSPQEEKAFLENYSKEKNRIENDI